MQTQATPRHTTSPKPGDSSPVEVLEAVGALREYLRTMDAQVRELQSERARLAAEVERLRGPSSAPPWQAEAHRVTDELDQLVRMYETVARRRGRRLSSEERTAPSSPPASESGSLLKKMVMLMMLTELA